MVLRQRAGLSSAEAKEVPRWQVQRLIVTHRRRTVTLGPYVSARAASACCSAACGRQRQGAALALLTRSALELRKLFTARTLSRRAARYGTALQSPRRVAPRGTLMLHAAPYARRKFLALLAALHALHALFGTVWHCLGFWRGENFWLYFVSCACVWSPDLSPDLSRRPEISRTPTGQCGLAAPGLRGGLRGASVWAPT